MKFGRPLSIDTKKRLKAFKPGDAIVLAVTKDKFTTITHYTVRGFAFEIRNGGRNPKIGASDYPFMSYVHELYPQWIKLARPQDIERYNVHLIDAKGNKVWTGPDARWEDLFPVLTTAPCKHCQGIGFRTTKGDEVQRYREEPKQYGLDSDELAKMDWLNPFAMPPKPAQTPAVPPRGIAQNIKLCIHCFGLG